MPHLERLVALKRSTTVANRQAHKPTDTYENLYIDALQNVAIYKLFTLDYVCVIQINTNNEIFECFDHIRKENVLRDFNIGIMK